MKLFIARKLPAQRRSSGDFWLLLSRMFVIFIKLLFYDTFDFYSLNKIKIGTLEPALNPKITDLRER